MDRKVLVGGGMMLNQGDANHDSDTLLAGGEAQRAVSLPSAEVDTVLDNAYAAYERTRRSLIAAEDAYARARLVLEQARARLGDVAPAPSHEYHYVCGHDGMVAQDRGDGATLSLCPACRRRLTTDHPPFTPIRTFVMLEPR